MAKVRIKIGLRRAQLIAEAVSVICPRCGEPQPDSNGSEMWTAQSFISKQGIFNCVSCDAPMLIGTDSKALFR